MNENVHVREVPTPFRQCLLATYPNETTPIIVRDDIKQLQYVVEQFDDTLGLQWRFAIPFDRLHKITPLLVGTTSREVLLVQSQKYRKDSVAIEGRLLDKRTGEEKLLRRICTLTGGWENDNHRRDVLLTKDSSHIVIYDLYLNKDEASGKNHITLNTIQSDVNLEHQTEATFTLPIEKEIKDLSDMRILDIAIGKRTQLYVAIYDQDSLLYIHSCNVSDASIRTVKVSLDSINIGRKKAGIDLPILMARKDESAILVSSVNTPRDDGPNVMQGFFVLHTDFSEGDHPIPAFHAFDRSKIDYTNYHLSSVFQFPSDTLVLSFNKITAEYSNGGDIIFNYTHLLFLKTDLNAKPMREYWPNRSHIKMIGYSDSPYLLVGDRDSLHCFYRQNRSVFSLTSMSRSDFTATGPTTLFSTNRNLQRGSSSWPYVGRLYTVLGTKKKATLVQITY